MWVNEESLLHKLGITFDTVELNFTFRSSKNGVGTFKLRLVDVHIDRIAFQLKVVSVVLYKEIVITDFTPCVTTEICDILVKLAAHVFYHNYPVQVNQISFFAQVNARLRNVDGN